MVVNVIVNTGTEQVNFRKVLKNLGMKKLIYLKAMTYPFARLHQKIGIN